MAGATLLPASAAIPRTDADANNANLINAIAFTAGFHFAFIEIGAPAYILPLLSG
jgi:hypothetical protein